MRRTWMVCQCLFPLSFALAVMLPAGAELPALIPREVLFCEPDRYEVQVSPDGKSIVYLGRDAKNMSQLWLQKIGSDKTQQLTKFTQSRVADFEFAEEGSTLLYRADMDGSENYHLYRLEIGTGRIRDLTLPLKGSVEKFDTDERYPDRAVMEVASSDERIVYQVHLPTGQKMEDLELPPSVSDWITDDQLVVGAAIRYRKDGSRDVLRL
ncbi:MAG TPA: hypothetical protein VGM23_06075, partial [Armatimonadota bacterium]